MHTYLGIFGRDPLGIVAVAPERTCTVRCRVMFSAVGAARRVRAWLVRSSGWNGQGCFEVSLAEPTCMTMCLRLVRPGAVAAAQLGCLAPSDCVAPPPASLTEGSTRIGGCSADVAAASAKEDGLVDNALCVGPCLGVPDVDVHLGGCTCVRVAYDAGVRSVLEVFGQGGGCNSSLHLGHGGLNLVDKVRVVWDIDNFHE